MKRQVVLWTSLPAGFAPEAPRQRRLLLSVLVSPRIYLDEQEDDKSLADTDFLDWPRHLREFEKGGFTVEIDGGPRLTVRPDSSAFDSRLWRRLFPRESTRVDGYELDRYEDREIQSYPYGTLVEQIRRIYQRTDQDDVSIRTLLRRAGLLGEPPNGGVDEKAARAFADFKQFHGWDGSPAPSGPQTWQPSFDFHAIVSALGDYPVLMRRLGLVIDLEIPWTAAIPHRSRLRVLPNGALGGPFARKTPRSRSDVAPFTAYDLDSSRRLFLAALRDGGAGDMQDGRLCLGNQNLFGLSQVDTDSAVMKLLLLADSLERTGAAGDYLAALRSAGLAVFRTGIATELCKSFDRTADWNDALESHRGPAAGFPDRQLFQEDVTAGFRVDVWDESPNPAFRRWYSLCRRVGHYQVGQDSVLGEHEDEGWVETAVSESPSAEDGASPAGQQRVGPLKVSEVLGRWEGWSLCAPRPGRKVLDQAASVVAQNPAQTSSGLSVSFRAKEGSLPRLRFGRTYRFRMRLVDLAGNGEHFSEDEPGGFLHATPPVTYYRFQPVESPVILPVDPVRLKDSPGESVDHLVVKIDPEDEEGRRTERFVAPPPASVALAEAHGMLDRADGTPDPDAYALISGHEGPVQVTADVAEGRGGSAGVSRARISYLPDPLARGFTVTSEEVAPHGGMGLMQGFGFYGGIPGSQHFPVWPEAQPIRAVLVAGDSFHVRFDPWTRRLEVSLPPAKTWRVRVSSRLDAGRVPLLGVWQWLREVDKHPAPEKAAEGLSWKLTPSRTVTLVHAVKRPLEKPALELQGPAAAEPDRPLRRKGETFLRLVGQVTVHSESTGKLDLLATWEEPVYDPGADAGVRLECGRSLILSSTVEPFSDLIVWSYPDVPRDDAPRHIFGDTKHRRVRYWPVAGTRFREYFSSSESDKAGTAQRGARTALLYDCQDPGRILSEPDFQIVGDAVEIDVPSSARPPTPRPLYAIPVFRWEDWKPCGPKSPDGTQSWLRGDRHGGGLRLYLEGPWYESGEGERLAVVIPDPKSLSDGDEISRRTLLPLVSRWGLDPVMLPLGSQQAAEQLAGVRGWSFDKSQFRGDPQVFEGLTPAELDEPTGKDSADAPKVTAVSYPVRYDRERRLWYADVEIDMGRAYFPFVRLALARLQPASVSGLELSPMALADFVQLAPDRSAWLKVLQDEAGEGKVAWVSVVGPAPMSQGKGIQVSMVAGVERQSTRIRDPDLGWHPVPGSTINLLSEPGDAGFMWWKGGPIKIPATTTSQRLRLMIREYQLFSASGADYGAVSDDSAMEGRLVYAHSLPLDD